MSTLWTLNGGLQFAGLTLQLEGCRARRGVAAQHRTGETAPRGFEASQVGTSSSDFNIL